MLKLDLCRLNHFRVKSSVLSQTLVYYRDLSQVFITCIFFFFFFITGVYCMYFFYYRRLLHSFISRVICSILLVSQVFLKGVHLRCLLGPVYTFPSEYFSCWSQWKELFKEQSRKHLEPLDTLKNVEQWIISRYLRNHEADVKTVQVLRGTCSNVL